MSTKKILISWLPLATTISLLSLLVYGVAQQTIRLSANNPQAQLAHDVGQRIVDGSSPTSLAGGDKVEITNKLAPYVIIYDGDNKIVASSATQNGTDPKVPEGIINYARQKGEDRVTWQPTPGVRQALVAIKYGGTGGYVVVSGRSLTEAERLIGTIGLDCVIGWLATMAASLVFVGLKSIFSRELIPTPQPRRNR